MSTYKRLVKLKESITRESFMKNKGLGNEIGYYIFDYPAKDELHVREWISSVIEENKADDFGLSICHIDLFDCMIALIDKKGFLDKTFTKEKERGTNGLKKPIGASLRLNEKNNLVIKYILENIKSNDVLFISGVGKVWPIIRSHSILNELHHYIDKNPVLLFFPGSYTKEKLLLFGNENEDDSKGYYRAFKIVD